MILNNAPQSEAIMSNVGQIGEFRIRNSAKAFSILSSGLYANKIRAIVRELSCNAVDSHTVAGNTNPFDVHIPTFLEPYFAIRDYGTGLNHDQVTSIYTTYFESTKTGSNDFIGALGLGSKSPFSYTDNFTVTAIKDGRKGIYTAFINEAGVPSIALMGEEETTEPAGVEVRFAVESRNDMVRFEDEARHVFRWFKQRPNFTGKDVAVQEVEYETKDIIPGVHVRKDSGYTGRSIAVMGNIAYPIEIPSSTQSSLSKMLACSLVMEFDIGELDFQASREGLSYVPQTLVAIENKLQALNARLADFVAEEADKIQNDWERAYYLFDKRRISLFANAVNKYATDKKFPLYDVLRHYGGVTLEHKVDDLAKDFNIQLRKFSISSHVNTCSKHESNRMDFGKKDATGRIEYESGWKIDVSSSITFVENDTKTGATERAKYHWRTKEKRSYTETVFVLEPVNRMQPMKVAEFYNAIHNPPEGQRVKASTLRMKDRATGGGMAKNVTILKMEERGGPRHYMKSRDLVWRDAGKAEDFDATLKHYYIPLSGFEPQWTKIKYNACGAVANMLEQSGISELQVVVYGVRKGDIEEIKKRSNWINLEEHIQAVFDKLGTKAFMACVREKLAINDIMKYNLDKIVDNIHVGPAYDLLKEFVGVPKSNNYRVMQELTSFFSPKYDLNAHTNKYLADIKAFNARYPLIEKLSHEAKETDIINYINLIDTVK